METGKIDAIVRAVDDFNPGLYHPRKGKLFGERAFFRGRQGWPDQLPEKIDRNKIGRVQGKVLVERVIHGTRIALEGDATANEMVTPRSWKTQTKDPLFGRSGFWERFGLMAQPFLDLLTRLPARPIEFQHLEGLSSVAALIETRHALELNQQTQHRKYLRSTLGPLHEIEQTPIVWRTMLGRRLYSSPAHRADIVRDLKAARKDIEIQRENCRELICKVLLEIFNQREWLAASTQDYSDLSDRLKALDAVDRIGDSPATIETFNRLQKLAARLGHPTVTARPPEELEEMLARIGRTSL